MSKKIEYEDKISIHSDPSIMVKNKVTDGNMNEIKNVVNYNADDLDYLRSIIDQLPSVSGEGESITLEPTIYAKLREIALKGNIEQNTTTGINLMDVSAVGSGTRNGITLTNNGDGTFTLNGTATAQNLFTLANMTLDTSKTYTLTGCPSGGSSTTYFIAGANFGDYGSGATAIPNREGISFSIVTQSGAVLNNVLFKPMLIEGSTQKPFEKYTGGTASPNPTYPQNIEVVTGTQNVKVENKNLFQFLTNETKTNNGITTTTNNSSITINGTSSGTVTIENKIKPLSLSGTYKLSGYTRNDNYVDLYYKNSGGTIQLVHCKDTPTINFNEGDTLYSIFIYIANGTTATFNNETFNLQLEKGTTATPYTPHQEQTQIVSLGDIELCKIGTYQDYIYKNNGNWYVKKNIGKYTFTGNETIDQFSSRTNTIRFSIANVLPTTLVAQEYNYNVYCNYLKAQDIYNNDVQGFFTHFNGISATRIYIGLDKTIASTSEQAKTWLGNVKPILYYQLRTPSDIEITNETLIAQLGNLENLMSYSGQTNISSDGDLPFIISVEAFKQLS